MKILTLSEFWDLVEDPDQPAYNNAVDGLVIKVAKRADYLCVYRNEELGNPRAGEIQIVPYGSNASTLEGERWGLPPTTLPDINGAINWRFQLVGVFAPGATVEPEVIEADIVRLYGKEVA